MLRDQALNAYWAFQVPKASLVLHDVAGMVSWGQNLLSDPIAHMFIGWVINMIKLLQPYRLQHRGITGNLHSESAFGWVFQFVCMAKGSARATDFVLCELPILWEADSIDYSAFISFQLYSSEAPRDLCLAIVSVTYFGPGVIFHHYDVSLHFHAHDTVIPVFGFWHPSLPLSGRH